MKNLDPAVSISWRTIKSMWFLESGKLGSEIRSIERTIVLASASKDRLKLINQIVCFGVGG